MTSAAAVTPSPRLFDYHCLLMPVQEQCQDEGDEEKYDVHDTEDPGSFEHCAILVDVKCPVRAIGHTSGSEDTQIDVDRTRGEVGAVFPTNSAQVVDSCNECAYEAQIDEGDEECRASSRAETNEGRNSPCAGEDRDDEEDQDEGWCKFIVVIVAMNEPCLYSSQMVRQH